MMGKFFSMDTFGEEFGTHLAMLLGCIGIMH